MKGKEEGKGSLGIKVLAGGLTACIVANVGLAGYQVAKTNKSDEKIIKFIDNQLERQAKEEEKANAYIEDGYLVGEAYEIRSTKAISDAYLSGDDSGLSAEDKETLEMAAKIFEKETKKCKSVYEKEVAIYEWMYKNIGEGNSTQVMMANEDVNDFTPHGVLSSKNAVCVGYATTFRLFMNMMGMDCHIVHNEYHSWNLVQLDDGEWYHVDLYSDVSAASKFCNFNMTDAVARSEHSWDGSALPEAKGSKYQYAVQNAKETKDLYAVPKLVKKGLDKKTSGVFCSFKKKLKEEDLPLADVLVGQMESAMMMTEKYQNADITARWYLDEDENYILALYLCYYESTTPDNTDVDEKTKKKMASEVEKIFGVDVSNKDYEYGYDYEK